MRVAVAIDVDRLDWNFLDWDAVRRNDDELLGLEFVSIGAAAEAKLHQPSWNSPQAGLGIAQVEPDHNPVEITRNGVAEPTSQRNGGIEVPRTENQVARVLPQLIGHAQNIGQRMLAVAVCRDDPDTVRVM